MNGSRSSANLYIRARPQVCQLCGFDRYVEWAHLIPRSDGGTVISDNIAILCPNHHRLFDHGLLSAEEATVIDALKERAMANPNSVLKLVI
jgi:predicted restriction endonuclease